MIMNALGTLLRIAFVSLLLVATGAFAAGDIHAMQAWSRATPPGTTVGVGYLTLHNVGKQARTLVSLSSPVAAAVEMHETTRTPDGMSRMRPLASITIPPDGTLTFEPSGKHLMLVGLKAPLVAGQVFPVTLKFEGQAPMTLEFDVKPLTGDARPAHDHGH
jgi:periplasmic copper chaperone A